MTTDDKKLATALVDELSTILGAMLDAPVDATPGSMTDRAWTVRISVSASTTVTMAFDEAGAGALTSAISRQADAPADTAVRDALREVCAQVISASALRASSHTDQPEIAAAELGAWTAAGDAEVVEFAGASLQTPLRVAIAVQSTGASASDAPRTAGAAAAVEPSTEERLDVILDIDLPLVVRFGCTDMPLKALARLGPGSLIDLGRSPDDPVEVLVGNRVVARGEVVVVSGSYGIRILDVVSPRERIDWGGWGR
jgi:flagellar motor switch protein FliN/FliY